MTTLFESSVGWLLRNARNYVLILALLVAAGFLFDAWDRWKQENAEIPIKEGVLEQLKSDLANIDKEMARHEAEWNAQREATERSLQARIRRVDDAIAAANQKLQKDLAIITDAKDRVAYVRKIANQKKARLEKLEKDSIFVVDLLFNKERLAELEVARAEYEAWDKAAQTAEAASATIPKIEPPKLVAEEREKQKILRQQKLLREQSYPGSDDLQDRRDQKQRAIDAMEGALQAQRTRVEQSPIQKIIVLAREWWDTAAWILAGAIVVPIVMKFAFYFGLARLAEGLPPIRVSPEQSTSEISHVEPSAVSVTIDIAQGDELLIHSDFLQSSSKPAKKHTQLFLNAAFPLSSLASGMVCLTRIRPISDVPARVVASSTKDPFGEVRVVGIPAGSSMVFQPRSLVGVVKQVGSDVRISRKWCLGSPHAWLTLQLRYLIFHGPCRLIIKGCRGVKVEEPQPGHPRLINQSATLGFSTNLEYSNTRCETFVSYFRGQEDLFNDLFSGGPGVFVYEEMPSAGRNTGVLGRGLEGILDAFFKALGI